MFDLKSEVQAWCRAAVPEDCRDDAQLAELEDHLLSEIERLQRAGVPTEEAFAEATGRLGEVKQIMSEYAKNQSFASRLCALDRRLSGVDQIRDPDMKRKASRLIIGHAILWAAAIVVAALLSRGSEPANYALVPIFAGLWLASFMLINTTIGALAGSGRSG